MSSNQWKVSKNESNGIVGISNLTHWKMNLAQRTKVCYPLTILNVIWITYSSKDKVYSYTIETETGDNIKSKDMKEIEM